MQVQSKVLWFALHSSDLLLVWQCKSLLHLEPGFLTENYNDAILLSTLTRPNTSVSIKTSKLSLTHVISQEGDVRKHRRASFHCFSWIQKSLHYAKYFTGVLSTLEFLLAFNKINIKQFYLKLYGIYWNPYPFQKKILSFSQSLFVKSLTTGPCAGYSFCLNCPPLLFLPMQPILQASSQTSSLLEKNPLRQILLPLSQFTLSFFCKVTKLWIYWYKYLIKDPQTYRTISFGRAVNSCYFHCISFPEWRDK